MTNYSKVRFHTLLEQPGNKGIERKWVADAVKEIISGHISVLNH